MPEVVLFRRELYVQFIKYGADCYAVAHRRNSGNVAGSPDDGDGHRIADALNQHLDPTIEEARTHGRSAASVKVRITRLPKSFNPASRFCPDESKARNSPFGSAALE